MDQALSLFVRDLYRGSTDSDVRNFQDWVMERLQSLIQFDSALWADAIFDGTNPANVHNFYLYGENFNLSTQELIKHYTQVHERGLAVDEIAIALTEDIGRTISWRDIRGTDAAVWSHPIYEHFARFYKQEHICSTSIANSGTEFITFISLYREDRDRPFTDSEKQIKSLVAPHLSESYRINLQFQALGDRKVDRQKAVGLVNEQGAIFYESESFERALLEIIDDPSETSKITDEPLLNLILEEGDSTFHDLRVTSRKTHSGLFLVVIHTDPIFRKLTPKQREILILIQQGKIYKEIAFMLGISYHAVDTQLREVRRKLKVKRLSMIPKLEGE